MVRTEIAGGGAGARVWSSRCLLEAQCFSGSKHSDIRG
jgi:hypothetical protein